MSSTRPIMVAGPMERNSKPRSNGSVEAFGGGPAGWPPRCAHNGADTVRQNARVKRERWLDIILSYGVWYCPLVTGDCITAEDFSSDLGALGAGKPPCAV